jgi:hypothetical protein
MKHFKLLISVVILGASMASLRAQTAQPINTGNPLVLEVQFLSGRPPSYQGVPRTEGKEWVWYALFGKTASTPETAGLTPVSAVRLTPWMSGDTVTIRVSAIREFRDADDPVGVYQAHEGETLTIDSLKKVGVDPFVIRVTRVALTETNPIPVINKTNSLEVLSNEPLLASLPAAKITLRNSAAKDVVALSVQTMRGKVTEMSGMPQNQEGQPLIKAGGTYELKEHVPVRPEQVPGGYQPTVPPGLTFTIETLVFADGTYEGNAVRAAKYRSFVCGHRSELKRLIPILQAVMLEADANTEKGAANLHQRILAQSMALDESDFADLAQQFPAADQNELRRSANVGVEGTRKKLLDEIARFEQGRASQDFRVWLKEATARYSAWLGRL